MKRKRSIDILGVKHKIKHLKLKEVNGTYACEDREIEISNEIIDQTQYNKVLMHEMFHGVLYLNGSHQDISLSQEHAIIDSFITCLFSNFDVKLKT